MTDSTDDVDWADWDVLEQMRKDKKKMGTVKVQGSKEVKIKAGNVEYSLPTELSAPVNDLGGYTMLIYGKKKIGKTTLASMFGMNGKKVLFLFFEPGGKALRLYQEPMTSWRKFTRFVELLKKDTKFGTVVIDTADYAYNDCFSETCSNLGVSHPSEEAYGKGWNAISTEFTKQIRALLKSGKGVIFISHQKDSEVEDRDGNVYEKTSNTLSGQAREVIEGLVDIWANYDYDKNGQRVLTILGSKELDAGHRLKERFKYTDGTRIRKISMGKSEQEGYENFVKAFNNKLEKGGVDEVVERKKTSLLKKK